MTTAQVERTSTGWTPDDSTFGARLALVRQRMSQIEPRNGWGNVKEAAEACGIPPESWRTWERDGVEPRRHVAIAMKIATRTGCDLDWLIRGPRSSPSTWKEPVADRPLDNRSPGHPGRRAATRQSVVRTVTEREPARAIGRPQRTNRHPASADLLTRGVRITP